MRALWVIVGVAACVLLLEPLSLKAATVTTALRLTNTDGTPLSPVGGLFLLTPGQTVDVVLSAVVNSPNTTDSFRSAANNNQPIGLQSLNVNILSPGTINQLIPSADPGTPPTWHNYADLTPNGSGVAVVYLIDPDLDGDLDPAGAGMAVAATSMASAASAAALANVQVGVTLADINVGEYTVGTFGGVLQALILNAGVYSDPANTAGDTAASKAALTVADVTGSSTSGQILFSTIPEPDSLGLLAAGTILFLRPSRLRTRWSGSQRLV